MSRATYIGFFAYLLVGFLDSSEGYGTKGGHQSFSQSYSSSSASAHSSSFSSSGSYSFGDKSILPIVGPIPIAKSTAVASASAGEASAVAGAVAGASAGIAKDSAISSSVVLNGKQNYGANLGFGSTHISSGGASSATSQAASSGGSYTSHTTAILPDPIEKGKKTDGQSIFTPPCCKKNYPGPDGSIYDYKVPPLSQTTSGYGPSNGNPGSHGGSNTVHSSSSGYGQVSTASSSYGSTDQKTPTNGTPGRKPCCKGPFPGPNGSIYDSKPASAVGTAVKLEGVQETTKPTLPLHRPPINFPGPSGSIYTSKPANSFGKPGSYPSGSQPEGPSKVPGDTPSSPSFPPIGKPSGSINGYQTSTSGANSYQTSPTYKPSCTSGNCEKQPPITYLQPPQNELKPVTEPAQEQPRSQDLPNSGYSGGVPQIQTVSTSTKPGTSGYQASGYNSGNVAPAPGNPGYQPAGPGFNQGVQKEVYQGGFSATGSSSSSSGYSSVGTYNHGSVQKPSVTIIDDTQRKEDGDKISYVSGPGSTSYTTGNAANFYPSVTENTIKGSGLIEGPRGSPLGPQIYPKPDTKASGFHEQEKDSAIVFVDGHGGSGSYSRGRGYSSSSGAAFSGSSFGVSNAGSKKPSGTYVSTVHVDFNKPGGSNQGSENSKLIGGNSGSYGYIGSSVGPKDSHKKPNGFEQGSFVGGSTGEGVLLGETSSSDNLKPNGGSSGSYGYIGSLNKANGNGQGAFVEGTGQGVISIGISSSDNSKLSGGNSGSYGYTSVGHKYSQNKPSGFGQGSFVGGSTGEGILLVETSSNDNKKPIGGSSGSYGYIGSLNKANGNGQGAFVEGTGQGVISIGISSSDNSKLSGENSGSYGYTSVGHKNSQNRPSGFGLGSLVGGSASSGEGVLLVETSSSDNLKPNGGSSGSYGYFGGSVGNLNKPSGHSQGAFVGGSGPSGQGVVLIETSPSDNSKLVGGSSGSYGYSSGSVGHKGISCTSSGCGTSYRQYSNGVPSSGTKNVAVHISSVPSGSYGKTGGSYGVISASGNGGSYGATSSSGGSGGGFLSSIFLDDGKNAGSHSKGGSYSHSGSFAKASSFASSSSFSSASAGSYSSGHY